MVVLDRSWGCICGHGRALDLVLCRARGFGVLGLGFRVKVSMQPTRGRGSIGHPISTFQFV